MKLARRIIVALFITLALLYAGATGYMYFNQRALQYVADGPITALEEAALPGAMAVAISSGDGVVNGWYQPPRAGKPLIVYFRGNSGSFSAEHIRFERFAADGYGFLAFDYRGFPMSPGSLGQNGILEDAIAAFDWAAAKGIPTVIWGRSLGSGPATYVASQRETNALLLETPFLSAVAVAWERYPFLPVGLVMQDQFPVDQWIAAVAEPVLIAHGTADATINVTHGERLHALVPNPDDLWLEPGAGHSDLWARDIWSHAEPFFARVMAD